ncbi:hypothetical protein ACFQZI_10270 [Mucilaginibacter lutimaris]|uniref:Outer membrane protein beta-barrel domain-containing protein n=1 Tax=Mucilaginibacter lutimaris TaxID=931629 RepID=A0ABW2ZGE0_9SPHI
MDEQFDKELSNHIREVFDNYEHPGANHGWELLQAKVNARKKGKKVAWLWWSSAAAVVLVFLGVLVWNNNQDTSVNNLAVKPVKQQQPAAKDSAAINNTAITPDKPEQVIANNPAPAFNNNIVIPRYVEVTPSVAINGKTQATTNTVLDTQPSQNSTTLAQQLAANQAIQPNNIIPNNNNAVADPSRTIIDSQKVAANVPKQPQLANNNLPVNNAIQGDANGTSAALSKQPPQPVKRSIEDMFAADKVNQTAKANKRAEKQQDKKVNFSVYAATYFNYAEGSTNQVNAGAGLTSDFKLTNKLKLSTGVSIAQNSLNYNTQAPPAASALAREAPALKAESLFSTAAVLPVFKNYNASLVGLDIPINIKYEFNPQKTDAYISAGLSSGTFINETYTYRYGYSGGAGFATNAAPEEQTLHNSFNSFYFAKTLNLSFGVGYPVGGNRLVIEPFVKYPLSGLGAQDIKFGAGGVNLKFSFKTQKR